MKTVFVRNDDVGALTEELEQISALLRQEQVPVSHAVIPGQLTSDCVQWLQQFLKECPELVEVHQHGWKHVDHGRKGEFGPERSYQEQHQDISQGKLVLQHLFDTRIFPCFTPPWHRYTTDTLQVLTALEFSCLSTKHTHRIPEVWKYPFQVVPVHLNLLKRGNGGWVVKQEEEWWVEWQSLQSYPEPLGILLHHEHFRVPEALKGLEHFIAFLKEKGVLFCKLGDVVKRRIC